jgi:LmbE family N-acetylglucosaminyl deacetylase
MKKIIFGIFAHPDDEAFGPAGTLLKLKSEGYDIHLILLTDGEAGTNPDNEADLGVARLKEWQTATDILGVASAHTLHYPDGSLKKTSARELDEVVGGIIVEIESSYNDPIELYFMSFEPQGLTGHLDHIAASELTTRMATSFKTREVWYFCLDRTQAPLDGTAYYEPRAREDSYITTKVDVTNWLDDKYRMMDAHISQRSDAAAAKKRPGVATECFRIESFTD